jgi:hypothetical protein
MVPEAGHQRFRLKCFSSGFSSSSVKRFLPFVEPYFPVAAVVSCVRFTEATLSATGSPSVGAPGIPVLNPSQRGTSNISTGSVRLADWRFCHPPTSAGKITHPVFGANANQ